MTEEEQLIKGLSKEEAEIMALQLSVTMMSHELEIIKRQMARWDEVYYHVFPERFSQDMKFEQQLHELKYPPKPDADKKKP